MEIDWITVAAQIVNFLVLVWLLQRFLYGPITRAMDRREQRIADRLRDAEEKKVEAEREAERLREKQRELDERRSALIEEAEQEADTRRKELEREAREDIDERRRAWRQQLDDERQSFLADLRRRTTEHVYKLARRALGDLADSDLEAQIVAKLTERLKSLDKAQRRKIAEAAEDSGSIQITSAFELPAEQKRQLTRTLHDELSSSVDVDYGVSDQVACGIEIRAGGQSLRWTLDSYLDRLEERLSAELAEQAGTAEAEAAQ